MAKRSVDRPISGVWEFFKTISEDNPAAECTVDVCNAPKGRKVSRGNACKPKKTWSLKALWEHLKTYHPEQHKKALLTKDENLAKRKKENDERCEQLKIYSLETASSGKSKQPTLQEVQDRSTKWSKDNPNQKKGVKLMMYWICDALLPYAAVENDQFKELMEFLQVKFNVPSEKELRVSRIPDLYKRLQYKIQTELHLQLEVGTNGPELPFCNTTDIWSSQARDSYMSVTVHYVTRSLKRKMLVLRAIPHNEKHSHESIRQNIFGILEDWGIGIPVAILRDSAANVTKAFLDWFGIACSCHTIQLVIKHSVFVQSGVKLMFTRAKKVVKRLKTPKGKRYFKKNNGVKMLKKQNDTRWNSKFSMVDSLLEEKTAVLLTQSEPELKIATRFQLTPADFELITKVIQVLKPFMCMTKLMEGENATASLVIPVVKKLRHDLVSMDARGIGTMRDETVQQLDKYFSDGTYKEFVDIESSPIYTAATILDPRFKLAAFRSKVKARIAKGNLITEICTELLKAKEPVAQCEEIVATSSKEVDNTESWGDILQQEPASTDESDNDQVDECEAVHTQFSTYLKEPLLPRDKDPLIWWDCHQKEYPLLLDFARKYLCIPASSAPSERLFKKTKMIEDPRPRILPSNLEMLMFIKYNLRAVGYDTNLEPPPPEWIPPNQRKIRLENQVIEEQNVEIEGQDDDKESVDDGIDSETDIESDDD